MTWVDLAIDYYNTNLKVEPLANKGRHNEEIEVYQQYNRRITVMMSNAHGRKHMHMNNGTFETLYIDDPEGRTKYGYIINCWNNRRTALTHTCGETSGAVRVGIASRFTRVVCAKCATGGRWWCFTSYLSVSCVNKMILKYQSGLKTHLANDMMKRAKGEGIVEIQQI